MPQIPGNNFLGETIKARAKSLGFSLSGFTSPAPLENYPRYEKWINSGFHGEMHYLASDRHRKLRQDPHLLTPWVQSIFVLGWPYALNHASPLDKNGQVAGYIDAEDYHSSFPRFLAPLIEYIQNQFSDSIQAEVFTDSSPVLERELANRAGLGWIGRNSCITSPKFGSAFLLAEIFLSVEIPFDLPFEKDLCGTCHRCLDACPTGCILPDRTLNAQNCISTLTVENKGDIPEEMRSSIGNRLFGCDVCQTACPWNRFAPLNLAPQNSIYPGEMIEMLSFAPAKFKDRFINSSILRAKRQGWVRNICTVLGNLKVESALPVLLHVVKTDTDPLCRISAATALLQIAPQKTRSEIQSAYENEKDPGVRIKLSRLL